MSEVLLRDINVNLLLSLDALLQERHVTRAASRVGVTQSAMSHALRRLREVFSDPLLVPGTSGMSLTPRAERLAHPLRRALQDLQRVLTEEEIFSPEDQSHTFRIATTDYISFVLLPPLLHFLDTRAPNVDLELSSSLQPSVIEMLETGELDLALTVSVDDVPGLKRRALFDEGFCCLVREGHPDVSGALTLEQYLEMPHALVSAKRVGEPAPVDIALAEMGLERRVALRVPYFLAAPPVVAVSNLVITVPQRMATVFSERFGLQLLEPPVELPRFVISMVWHERFDLDPAHRWIRGAVVDALANANCCWQECREFREDEV